MNTPLLCPICGETVRPDDRIVLTYVADRGWFVLEHHKDIRWEASRKTCTQWCAQAGHWELDHGQFVKR